jgi:hypothetical protein
MPDLFNAALAILSHISGSSFVRPRIFFVQLSPPIL